MKIFQRGAEDSFLTYAGEKYLAAARRLIALEANLDRELQELRGDRSGKLRIGISSMRATFLLPQVLPAFLEEHRLDFTPQEIQGLFLNFRFDGSRLTCTTGVSVSKFTLDKSLEQTWDKWAQALFAGLQIPFESEL